MKACLLVLGACNWSLHRMNDRPERPPLTPPESAVPLAPPEEPPALTRELVVRGGDRFQRMCTPCHGIEGDGDSDVARVMMRRKPPSLVDPTARKLSDDRIVSVITSGYGFMPSYASAVAFADRYAILHYIRALQLREVELQDKPEASAWLP